MGMPVLARWSWFAALAVAAGCSAGGVPGPASDAGKAVEPTGTTRSCATSAADAPTSDAAFGAVVGRVRCTVYGSLTPADHGGLDGDATHVRAGQALHRVSERSRTEAVGAYVEGRPYIFVTEQEFRERSAGRCTVPLTQACPSWLPP